MNLLWRMLWIIFISRFHKKINLFDKCSTTFHVLPTDIDILLHMNNGRYFSLMDLARTNQMIRTGYFPKFRKAQIYPIIASEAIRFRKSINLFRPFTIQTQLLGWDDKFVYVSQLFVSKNIVCALALVKVCFLEKQSAKRLTTEEFKKRIGLTESSPPLPAWVHDWVRSDQQYHDDIIDLS